MSEASHYRPSGNAGSCNEAEKANKSEGLMNLRLAFFFTDDTRKSGDNQRCDTDTTQDKWR